MSAVLSCSYCPFSSSKTSVASSFKSDNNLLVGVNVTSWRRTAFLFSFLFVAHQQAFAEQTLITFDEIVGNEVQVSDQYLASKGIRFLASAAIGLATEVPNCQTVPQTIPDSGVTYYGFSNPPALRCRHPGLYFPTDPDVGIIARFYDTEVVPRQAAYARNVSFDLMIVSGSRATVTTYSANGTVKDSVSVTGAGFHQVVLPGVMHKFHISVLDSGSKFGIDNVSFELLKLKIKKPTANQHLPLNLNDSREAEVEYEANILDRAVTFSTKLEYETTLGGRGMPSPNPLPETFNGSATGPVKRTYTAKGGKLTVDATFSEDGVSSVAQPVTAFIVGTSIPDPNITSRLYAAYRGATRGLMTGIAAKESSYRHFSPLSKYGITSLWPTESVEDGGSHIGLMQVATTYTLAWDWYENVAFAVRLFTREKLSAAQRNEARIRRGSAKSGLPGHIGLRQLTDVETENMAVLLYGPYAPGSHNVPAPTLADKLQKQYYIPVCVGGTVVPKRGDLECQGGTWDWAVNTTGNPQGVAYANSVRAMMR